MQTTRTNMMQYPEELKAAESWSLMSNTPLCFYYKEYDAHLVYWGGVVMTRAFAIIIYSQVWLNMSPPPSLKLHAYNEYNRLYRTGLFGHQNWDTVFEKYGETYNMHNYLVNQICLKTNTQKFFTDLKKKYKSSEAFSWFMSSRETVIQSSYET